MDFINSIQNLQQKPRHVRRKILFISVTVCMIAVIASWLMIAGRRIDLNMFDASNMKAQIETAASPFDVLKNTFTETIDLFLNKF